MENLIFIKALVKLQQDRLFLEIETGKLVEENLQASLLDCRELY
mgnify:CR=1 FL=1